MKFYPILLTIYILVALPVFANDCAEVKKENTNLIAIFESKGFTVAEHKDMTFNSGNETNTNYHFVAGKEYVVMLLTEKFIDQSGISVLNKFGFIVASNFKETGSDRHLVMVQYKPVNDGDYSIAFKTIDFAGRNICGSWTIFSR
jgi:hypothetical protein